MTPVVKGDLGSVDRPQPRGRGRLGELHGAEDSVVVGQGDRIVAELERGGDKLLGKRRAIEEGVGGVAVELGVHSEHMFA